MAVRIRLKRLGRRHRPFFRVCAMDARSPRDGRVLEELGTYDPMVPDTDARALLKRDRVDYWLSVGAKPTEKVAVLIKKYGTDGTHVEAQRTALDRMAQPAPIPDPGEPASLPKSPEPEAPPEPPASEAATEGAGDAAPAETAEAPPAEPESQEPKEESSGE